MLPRRPLNQELYSPDLVGPQADRSTAGLTALALARRSRSNKHKLAFENRLSNVEKVQTSSASVTVTTTASSLRPPVSETPLTLSSLAD